MPKNSDNNMQNLMLPFGNENEYFKEPVCFKDCENHYELIYTGEFESVGRESVEVTKLMQDLKEGDKDKELHIFINSIGGDVEQLSMILQQVLQYNYIVTICCGSALSAGFILWSCGHEKYVSSYSELMYHTISSGYSGKGVELSKYGTHIERLTEKIMEAVNMSSLISEEDIKEGKSTEVWYTGDDFINAGKAKDYKEYLKREIPVMAVVTLSGNRFFAKSGVDKYVELVIKSEQEYTYDEIIQFNKIEEQEDINEQIMASSSSEPEEDTKNTKKKKKKRLIV